MAGNVTETVDAGKGSPAVTRSPRARKQIGIVDAPNGIAPRFFLARPSGDGKSPAFERECGTEAEAMIESLKKGLSYYVVLEYRAFADCSGKQPQINKEVVKRDS